MANSKRKCTYCSSYFAANEMIIVTAGAFCSDEHRYKYGIERTKELHKKTKELIKKQRRKDKLEFLKNDKSYRAKQAQAAFNAYIRERDKHLPCISCQRHHKGQYHAGHYRSVGAASELRFEEKNCHKQCSACNNYLSGNIADYRINLIKKIGADAVEWLEGPHESKRYRAEDYLEIEQKYKKKLKDLKNSRG